MGREAGLFRRPHLGDPTRHLLLANCDPSRQQEIEELFAQWGPISIAPASSSGPPKSHCFVSLRDAAAAAAAQRALNGATCAAVGGHGPLVVTFAEKKVEEAGAEDAEGQRQQPAQASQPRPEPPLVAVRKAEECGIPGLAFYPDFVTPAEEEALLEVADRQQRWQLLARRRVLHFGWVFDYETRGVGPPLHPIPEELLPVAARIQLLPDTVDINQLTVNEYACGVGISPHVETHSAFTAAIASLSLAGPAVMVMRREGHTPHALFLPPRSLLVMSGEARYCWQHYIPHRKSDPVAGSQEAVPRAGRRMSFTFRQVRGFPCDCPYPDCCDSQLAPLAPTRIALKRMAMDQQQQAAAGASSGSGFGDGGNSSRSDGGGGSSSSSSSRCAGQASAAAGGGAASSCEASCIPQPPTQHLQASLSAGSSMTQTAAHPLASADVAGAGGSNRNAADPAADAVSSAPPPAGSFQLDRQLAALEEQYVHSVYNAIAPHFAATRFAVWPRVREFLEGLPAGALLADVGCGNGKYFGVRRDVFVLGSDRSEGLAKVASRRLLPAPGGERLRADVAVADGMVLPYRPASCDGALCIAVLHHIASPDRRVALLAQLLRILRPGGRALVTVWATEQGNMKKVRSWQPVSAPAAGAVPAAGAPAGAEMPAEEGAAGAAGAAAQAAAPAAAAVAGEAALGAAASAAASSHSATAAADLSQAAPVTVGSTGKQEQQRSQQQQQQQQQHADGAAAVASGDYFVPWHLPFHRAEAAVAARHAINSSGSSCGAAAPAESSEQQQAAAPPPPQAQQAQQHAPCAAGASAAASAPQIDSSKGAVVFQRYYHLFDPGELQALVQRLPGARVVDAFYDKDNWCCVFERVVATGGSAGVGDGGAGAGGVTA